MLATAQWDGQVRGAVLVARVPAASDGDVLDERGFIDATWVPDIRHRRLNVIDIPTLAFGLRVRWMSFRASLGTCCPAVTKCWGVVVTSWGFGSEPYRMSFNLWTGEIMEPAFSWLVDEDRRSRASRTLVVEGTGQGTVAIFERQAGDIRVRDLAGNVLARYAFAEDAVVSLSEEDRVYLQALRGPEFARRTRSWS